VRDLPDHLGQLLHRHRDVLRGFRLLAHRAAHLPRQLGHADGAPADLGGGRLGALAVAVQACHSHAMARDMQGGRLADAAAGADDCDHVVRIVEIVHATVLPRLNA
jgi:hypothetical protein